MRLLINVIASPAVAWQRHQIGFGRLGAFPQRFKSIQHANGSHSSKVDRNCLRRKSIRQIGRHFFFKLSRCATQVTQCGALCMPHAASVPMWHYGHGDGGCCARKRKHVGKTEAAVSTVSSLNKRLLRRPLLPDVANACSNCGQLLTLQSVSCLQQVAQAKYRARLKCEMNQPRNRVVLPRQYLSVM